MFPVNRVYNLATFLEAQAFEFAPAGDGLPPEDPPDPVQWLRCLPRLRTA